MNEAVYQIACFMCMREPLVRRWDHTRHHTDTVIVGRDREIIEERPPSGWHLLGITLGVSNVVPQAKAAIPHLFGKVAEDEKLIIPESEWPSLRRNALVLLVPHALVILASIVMRTWLPLMWVGLPTLYGSWFMVMMGLTQHIGLAEDVTDHRLNTRTVYMNPVFRFLYWNMNYHLEHHMFPMVPFHALKDMHEEIKDQMPAPYRSTIEAYKEIIPTLRRQTKDASHYVHRVVPSHVSA
jgi:fatty acid desaturase